MRYHDGTTAGSSGKAVGQAVQGRLTASGNGGHWKPDRRTTEISLEQAVPYSKLHCTLAWSVYEAPDDCQQLPLQTLSSRLRNNLRPIGDRL